MTYSNYFYKSIRDNEGKANVNLLLMLVLLVAVGQMAQTIYIPAIADMARDLNVREGAVQSVMALLADLRCLTAVLWPDFRPRGPLTGDPRRNVHFYAGNAGRGHDLQFDGVDCRQRDAGDGHRRWRRNGAYFAARFI